MHPCKTTETQTWRHSEESKIKITVIWNFSLDRILLWTKAAPSILFFLMVIIGQIHCQAVLSNKATEGRLEKRLYPMAEDMALHRDTQQQQQAKYLKQTKQPHEEKREIPLLCSAKLKMEQITAIRVQRELQNRQTLKGQSKLPSCWTKSTHTKHTHTHTQCMSSPSLLIDQLFIPTTQQTSTLCVAVTNDFVSKKRHKLYPLLPHSSRQFLPCEYMEIII